MICGCSIKVLSVVFKSVVFKTLEMHIPPWYWFSPNPPKR